MTDRECVQTCIKAGGKYVFVTNGKVYSIANQDDPDLVTHAGHTVQLTWGHERKHDYGIQNCNATEEIINNWRLPAIYQGAMP